MINLKMDSMEIYNSIIKTLQNNDRNGTYDEILEDADNDFSYAVELLKSCLERVVNDEGLEGEELEFYKEQLKLVNDYLV